MYTFVLDDYCLLFISLVRLANRVNHNKDLNYHDMDF